MRVLIGLLAATCLVGLVSSSVATSAQTSEQKQSQKNFCQGCRALVSYVSHFNVSTRRDSYKQVFKSFCETYYPVSTDFREGPCPLFVNTLFLALEHMDPVDSCDRIGACEDPTAIVPSLPAQTRKPSPFGDNVFCGVCKQVVNQVKETFQNKETIDDIRNKIDAFCSYLRSIDEDKECRRVMDKYLEQALEFVHDIDAERYCQQVQLCDPQPPATSTQPDAIIQPLPSLIDFKDFGIEMNVEVNDKVVKSYTPATSAQDQNEIKMFKDPNCMFCKKFVQEMFKFLKDNRTEENIEFYLDKVCDLVYKKDAEKKTHCDQLVTSYSQQIIKMLADETDPELICMILEQCHYGTTLSMPTKGVAKVEPVKTQSASHAPSMGELITLLDPSVKFGSVRSCVECKVFLEYIRNAMGRPKTAEEVKNWLEKNLCNNLDENGVRDSCLAMVGNYTQIFLQAVMAELSPQQACVALGACNKRPSVDWVTSIIANKFIPPSLMEKMLGHSADDKPSCDACEQTVVSLDQYLSFNPSTDNVETLGGAVCHRLANNSALRVMCEDLIAAHGPDMAHNIATMNSPIQLCKQLDICSN